jgi:hypothetical protein
MASSQTCNSDESAIIPEIRMDFWDYIRSENDCVLELRRKTGEVLVSIDAPSGWIFSISINSSKDFNAL